MTKRRRLEHAAAAAAAEQVEQQQVVPELMGPADEIDLEMPGSFFNMGEDCGIPPEPLIMPIYGAAVAGMHGQPAGQELVKRKGRLVTVPRHVGQTQTRGN